MFVFESQDTRSQLERPLGRVARGGDARGSVGGRLPSTLRSTADDCVMSAPKDRLRRSGTPHDRLMASHDDPEVSRPRDSLTRGVHVRCAVLRAPKVRGERLGRPGCPTDCGDQVRPLSCGVLTRRLRGIRLVCSFSPAAAKVGRGAGMYGAPEPEAPVASASWIAPTTSHTSCACVVISSDVPR